MVRCSSVARFLDFGADHGCRYFPGISEVVCRSGIGWRIRIWAVAPYIIFYRVNAEGVTVRVLRGRRNVTIRLFSC